MSELKSVGQDAWNESYTRGGNITFYPDEEVVRFINRYVRKRRGISEFENIMEIDEKEWRDFKSLDLGCGIGRHVRILDEFGLNPYGIDLSDTAINFGKRWLDEYGKHDVSERLIIGSVAELPYKDEFFDICISYGVLDSMPRDIAKQGIAETHRTLKNHGLFFLSLIMDNERKDEDVVVNFGYEKDTVQSYFTEGGITDFLHDCFDIVDMKIVLTEDVYYQGREVRRLNENLFVKNQGDSTVSISKRAYIVAKRK